jgi:hypothetical protein
MSAVSFASPSMRASGSDLTVAISPLGLVELADEEFEVHGPRLNRYAQNWAFYLGHHWAYRRENGETQITFNYVKAFADFINNFSFSRGVHFGSAKQYQHIVPSLLKRVWEVDNEKPAILWELGNQGGVSGDVFVKVAYDPAWVDAAGGEHPGRVRVLPLNASFCFPEWHPHDRSRLLRFKLKYRFWGTSAEGTRQVYTYTEIITDDAIEEYVNDELVDSRQNPLGTIPVIHIANTPVSSSPWGLSDVGDIVSLNRTYNELFTDIMDIVNYHAAPVTIITGAKASNLEKGPKKVWGGLPKDANVFNLENGVNLAGPLQVAEALKRAMHEMTGVPESALGQMQPISNTSGVALAIMYQPMMQRYNLKKLQYGVGLKRINELILRTLFCFEPDSVYYDPNTEGIMREGMAPQIDPADPLVYESEIEWAPPLPVDALIKLQEVQQKMALGLESKRGALKDLGDEFPDEKIQEIFEEMVQDAKEEGALNMLKAQISSAILAMTGMSPDDGMEAPGANQTDKDGNPVQEVGGPDPQAMEAMQFLDAASGGQAELMSQLVTQAYGTKLGSRRNPDNDSD